MYIEKTFEERKNLDLTRKTAKEINAVRVNENRDFLGKYYVGSKREEMDLFINKSTKFN